MTEAIKSIEKCTFQKGDVLIITAARAMCDRERLYVYQSASRVLPEDVSVLILDNGMETEVLSGKTRRWKKVTGCLLSVAISVAVAAYLLGFGEE